MRKIGRFALCISRFRNSTKTAPLTLPFATMKRLRPRALTAEILFTELRCPVLRTTGVLPRTPQVVPPWQSDRHPRLITKVDIRHCLPGLFANHRVLLFPPLLHSFRILLHRTEQGTLARQPQLLQQATHTRQTQFQPELFPQQNSDHLPRPQRKLEPVLQWTLCSHRPVQPSHLLRAHLPGPSLQRAGFECAPTSGAIARQPGIDATPAKTQCLNHDLRALSCLDSLHCANPNLFQRLVSKPAGIASFHAAHYTICLLIYALINIQRAIGTSTSPFLKQHS